MTISSPAKRRRIATDNSEQNIDRPNLSQQDLKESSIKIHDISCCQVASDGNSNLYSPAKASATAVDVSVVDKKASLKNDSQPTENLLPSLTPPSEHFNGVNENSSHEPRYISRCSDNLTAHNSPIEVSVPPSDRKGTPAHSSSPQSENAQILCEEIEPEAPVADKSNWQGFCEIESDPAFFTIMLEEFGVRGVRVDEVFDLDMLSEAGRPIVYGLVLLYRYFGREELEDSDVCHSHVWFANQVATNSCATMAMLNIVNNVPELELGDHLESFKEFTKGLTPAQRGDALMHFEYVKRIHNSFARKSDILEADLAMKNRFVAASRRKQSAEKGRNHSKRGSKRKGKKSVNEDDEFKANGSDCDPRDGADDSGSREPRGTRSGDAKSLKSKTSKYMECEEEAAFHFVAFVPIKGEIWKLDGMNKLPVNLGPFEEGFGWLEAVRPVIETMMAEANGEINFNLMALLQDPLEDARRMLAENIRTISTIENTLHSQNMMGQTANPEGDPKLLVGASPEFGITEKVLAATSIPQSIETEIRCGNTSRLISLRQTWVKQQERIRSAVQESMRRAEADQLKAANRRVDYGDFIAEWVKMLAEGEHIQPLVEEVGL